jgi:hypothetical protein
MSPYPKETMPMIKQPPREARMDNVLAWLETAKEVFPAINNNAVPADRVASISELVDRMQRMACSLAKRNAVSNRHAA